MFIARWQFSARFGKADECISILRKWEIDVGQRIGWKPGSVRLLTGYLGTSVSSLEFEVRFDSVSDLEAALRDMERVPHHREYMKMLEPFVAGGTDNWVVLREADAFSAS